MTIKELINRLEVLYDASYEDAPGEAADAVCEFLTSNGHQDIVEKYDYELMHGSSVKARRMLSETLDELGYEDIIPLRLRIFY
jgi:hypothetical protein